MRKDGKAGDFKESTRRLEGVVDSSHLEHECVGDDEGEGQRWGSSAKYLPRPYTCSLPTHVHVGTHLNMYLL